MIRVLGTLYGAVVLVVGIATALPFGLFGVLPFVVIPRGRRERYTMTTASWWGWLMTYVVLCARPQVTGAERIVAGQGALYVCNHRSWLDPLLLMAHTRSIGLSKAQVFWIPFVGLFGYLAGAVFFNRTDPAQRKRARNEVMASIAAGNCIQLFPEGTRSRDGRLRQKVHTTLIRDCYDAGLTVVPCAVYGTERVLPVGVISAYPFQRCRLDMGEPMRPEDWADDKEFAEAVWAEVKRRVEAMADEA